MPFPPPTDPEKIPPHYNCNLEKLRRQEYPSLRGVTYLDHAGTTPYAKSLIKRFSRDMRRNLYGNPHSVSPSSDLSTRRIARVRERILRFFNADPDHFDLVFVANASAGIKLVAEAFREVQAPGFWYGYHRDAHTSLVGIRQLATSSICFECDQDVDSWIQAVGNGTCPTGSSSVKTGLFAYPAQSNMNGHRLPLRWARDLRRQQQENTTSEQKVYTLLDAAAYVMTAQLDLSNEKAAPDFTALSFYKIFGFPDLGALIVRKAASDVLRKRRYFGGGTVDMVTVMKDPWHAKKDHDLHETLEDGTLPFHHIMALDSALDVHAETFGVMTNVSNHTCALAAYAYDHLQAFRHANGQPVCWIYKDDGSQYGDPKTQGPTIAFNIKNAQGGWLGKSDVERLAIVRGIHLRTGGVCNPGGIATFCNLAHWELRRNFSEGMRCGDDLDIIGGKPTGVVRVSFGAMSNQRDVDTLLRFVDDLFVEKQSLAEEIKGYEVLAVTAGCPINNLTTFPIVGCAGWDIPPNVNWPIGGRGLAWNYEWCILSQGTDVPLDPNQHPRLLLIKPKLDIERGVLKLSGPEVLRHTETTLTLDVSLWDTPVERHHVGFDHIPADLYRSEAVRTFCTSVLGIPCTLARFRDHRRVSNGRRFSIPALPASQGYSLTLSLPSHRSRANITLPYDAGSANHRFIRINQHVFEKIEGRETANSPSLWNLRYVQDIQDRSPKSQNPCISVGDVVSSSNEITGAEYAAMRPSMAFLNVGKFVCAVWHCRKESVSQSELALHLRCHGIKKRSRFFLNRNLVSSQDVRC